MGLRRRAPIAAGMWLLIVVGCTAGGPSEPPGAATADDPVEAPSMTPAPTSNEEEPMDGADVTHRTTVITDAGRVDAIATSGAFDVDVERLPGWEYVIDRDDDHIRIASRSAGRSVVVELRSGPGGITQEVTTSN